MIGNSSSVLSTNVVSSPRRRGSSRDDNWIPAFAGMTTVLNEKQLEAVLHEDGPLLILAGAGSGKTRVLVHRMAHLIMDKTVPPDRILAVTFTNKASNEMKKRVELLTGVAAGTMWVSTFHSFCLRLLRKHAGVLGYKDNFVIFDMGDQVSLIKACLKALSITEEKVPPKTAVAKISRAKDDLVSVDIFERDAANFWDRQFAPVYRMYQEEMQKQNAMDFGDLIMNLIVLFERAPDVLRYYQDYFQHILVDEYQDTNRAQYKLVRDLAALHENILVVGDDDQSIYRWRGADINNILNFQKDFAASTVVRLEQNYRSTPTILAAANSVIKNNKGRLGKELWSDLPDRERVSVIEKPDALAEAKFVAGKIAENVLAGARYDDSAIFYRTNAQSRVFEECFRNSGIPYVIYGGVKFYERMEIKDVLSYLKLIMEPANDTALSRIINVPVRGIGKSTIEKVRELSVRNSCSMIDAMKEITGGGALNARSGKNLSAFVRMIDDCRVKLHELSLGDFVAFVLETSGYIDFYKKSPAFEAEDRLENIEEFVKATREFSGMANITLLQFLDQVALVSDVDRMDEMKGAVPLMTVHLSKGLEFPTVFMAGMEESLFPHSRSLDSDIDIEEERRLCYVGMTRAKQKLYMIYTNRRMIHGREQYNVVSRFIDEVDEKYVDRTSAFPYFAAPKMHKASTFAGDGDAFYADDIDQRPSDEQLPLVKLGSRVRHSVFGDGVVLKVDGEGENLKLMIRFTNGQLKTLIMKYANLEIL